MAVLGEFIIYALETVINAGIVAMAAIYTTIMSLLPSISDAPTFTDAPWLHWLAWFFPVSTCIGIFAGAVAMYVTYLGYRYILRLVRGL